MTTDPDREDEMLTLPRDLDLADSILDGDPLTADAPAHYQRVVELVQAARQTPAQVETVGDISVIAVITATVREPSATPKQSPRRSRAASRVGVLLVGAIVLGGTGAAAAATNHLPDAVQSFVSSTAGHLGIDVPSPDDDRNETTPAVDAGPPASQPGASAGSGGNDQRPDCAGNPSSDAPGCAVGQEDQSTSSGNGTPGGPPSTKHDNNGNPDPGPTSTTERANNSGGVGSDQAHDPHQSSSS
ncbi:MAG: hypothetical protein QOE63_918 [Acidimicrobiaceae bacterium]|jgi:hypothetical protein